MKNYFWGMGCVLAILLFVFTSEGMHLKCCGWLTVFDAIDADDKTLIDVLLKQDKTLLTRSKKICYARFHFPCCCARDSFIPFTYALLRGKIECAQMLSNQGGFDSSFSEDDGTLSINFLLKNLMDYDGAEQLLRSLVAKNVIMDNQTVVLMAKCRPEELNSFVEQFSIENKARALEQILTHCSSETQESVLNAIESHSRAEYCEKLFSDVLPLVPEAAQQKLRERLTLNDQLE